MEIIDGGGAQWYEMDRKSDSILFCMHFIVPIQKIAETSPEIIMKFFSV